MPKRGRPPIPAEKRRVTLAVRVRPETKADLAWLAKAALSSMGEVVDVAVEKLVEGDRKRADRRGRKG